jgi:hypothetical protein
MAGESPSSKVEQMNLETVRLARDAVEQSNRIVIARVMAPPWHRRAESDLY